MCAPCKQRWEDFLKQETMKESKTPAPEQKVTEQTAKAYQKPNIDKIIEDRRKALSDNKIINK